MSVYRVVWNRTYREHRQGDVFETVLRPDAEERALKLGAIEIVKSSTPSIRPGSETVPEGWLNTS
jgi:hypothetical protein